MKNIAFFALFAVAGILSATPVTVSADLVNAGTPLLASGGYYVGPYTLSINGVSYAAMCVDFTDEGVIGQHYSAYETQVGGNLSNTYNPTASIFNTLPGRLPTAVTRRPARRQPT
jgi:hypothetical protein